MKRPMVRFLLPLACVLVLAAAGPVRAQSSGLSLGDKAKKFTLPLTENGELKMKISGDEATKLSVNRTEIMNMKIEVMSKGLPETIITSPRAYFWTQDQRLQTRNGVRIDRGDMLITAKSMEWQLKNDKGTLRRGVTVKLTGFDVGNRKSMTQASKNLGGAIPIPDETPVEKKPEEKKPKPEPEEKKELTPEEQFPELFGDSPAETSDEFNPLEEMPSTPTTPGKKPSADDEPGSLFE